MIIVRSPLRISLCGGGTDIPFYYEKYGGFCISAAIDKYVYVSVNRMFKEGISVRYSENQIVSSADEIKHEFIRAVLKDYKINQIEITTTADVHAGTGLGSSGSFGTAFINALESYTGYVPTKGFLANRACYYEMDVLKKPSGKQDQYISAYGGIRKMWFDNDGEVEIEPAQWSQEFIRKLENSLLLFYTDKTHSSSSILGSLRTRLTEMKEIDRIGREAMGALDSGDLYQYAGSMAEHWKYKHRIPEMSNPEIDRIYELGVNNGAMAGKLVGAGGGGFILFVSSDKQKLRKVMKREGIKELRFEFDHEGTKRIA